MEQVLVSKNDLQSLESIVSKLKYENGFLLSAETLLESKCASLDSRLEETRSLLEVKNKIIASLKTDLESQKALMHELSVKTALSDDLVSSNKGLEDALMVQMNTMADICGEHEQLKENLTSFKIENKELMFSRETSLNECEILRDEMAKMKKLQTKLEHDIVDVHSKNESLNSNLQMAKDFNSELSIKLEVAEASLKSREDIISELNIRINSVLSDRDTALENSEMANRKVSELESSLKKLSMDLDSQRIKHGQELNDAREASHGSSKELYELQQDSMTKKLAAESRFKDLEAQLKQRTIELEDISSAVESERRSKTSLQRSLKQQESQFEDRLNRSMGALDNASHQRAVLIRRMEMIRLACSQNSQNKNDQNESQKEDLTTDVLSKSYESLRMRKLRWSRNNNRALHVSDLSL